MVMPTDICSTCDLPYSVDTGWAKDCDEHREYRGDLDDWLRSNPSDQEIIEYLGSLGVRGTIPGPTGGD